ncbi:MAG: nucleotidyltransferase domain-containing protein [Halioglobus sp.]
MTSTLSQKMNDQFLKQYISAVIKTAPDIESIWLIGSRANDTAREESDWDLLVFANGPALKKLQKITELAHSRVDLLVVYNGDDFKEPWPDEAHNNKTGALSDWNWQKTGSKSAQYTSTKYYPDDDSDDWFKGLSIPVKKTLKGKLLWQQKD